MNCAVFSGKIANEPRLHTAKDGTKFVTFELVVHRPKTRDMCDYIDCFARDEKAEFVLRNFQKGSSVEVKGIMTTRNEEYDGVRRKKTELRIEEANFGRSSDRE